MWRSMTKPRLYDYNIWGSFALCSLYGYSYITASLEFTSISSGCLVFFFIGRWVARCSVRRAFQALGKVTQTRRAQLFTDRQTFTAEVRALHRCCLSVLPIPTRVSETRDGVLWENVREWSIRVPAVQTDRSSLRVSRTLPGHCRAAEPRVGDGGWLRAVAMGVMQGDRDRLELHLHPQVW